MAVNAYLNFGGNCREAVAFYAGVFGAQPQPIMTYGDVKNGYPMPEEAKNLVMHTELTIMGDTVMFSDVPDASDFIVGNNVSLVVTTAEPEQVDRLFDKLKVGGKATVEPQTTFWTKRYAYVTDRFGIGWQLSYEEAKA